MHDAHFHHVRESSNHCKKTQHISNPCGELVFSTLLDHLRARISNVFSSLFFLQTLSNSMLHLQNSEPSSLELLTLSCDAMRSMKALLKNAS